MIRGRNRQTRLVRRGVLLAVGVLALTVAHPVGWPVRQPSVLPGATTVSATNAGVSAPPPMRVAAFGHEEVSPEVRHVANWAVYTGDHKALALVIVDKKAAKVFVFNPRGELVAVTPALLGSAHGDHTVPGIGDRPLSQVLPEERTTPAGRFIAEPGINTHGEDIVWVDYEAAVSLHRVRANNKSERRLERLASPSVEDNRISFGCINLPVTFYESVLSPTVRATGAVIYVLPETRTPAEVFGSFDVPAATQHARR